jgi:hypothetical protein
LSTAAPQSAPAVCGEAALGLIDPDNALKIFALLLIPRAAPGARFWIVMQIGMQGDPMLVRLVLGVALAVSVLLPISARADCAQEVSKLMSRDTEKLTTRYNRVRSRIEKQGDNRSLAAEECRVAKALQPMLIEQIAALRQSGCSKDPQVGTMLADIVRGHEDDLAMVRKTVAKPACR